MTIGLIRNLNEEIQRRVEYFGAQPKTFAIVCLLNCLLFNFLGAHYYSLNSINSALLTISGTLCIPLLLKEYWPENLLGYLASYWYFTLTFCLPFFSTYMLLAAHGTSLSLSNSVFNMFFLVLLVDFSSFLAMGLMGLVLGTIFYHFSVSYPSYEFITLGHFFSVFMAPIIVAALFARNNDKLQRAKIEALGALTARIAHELRTPLLSIHVSAAGTKTLLAQLLTGYHLAKEHNLDVPLIPPHKLKALESTMSDIEREIKFSNAIIDMLLISMRKNVIEQSSQQILSMKECINEALHRYPADSNEKSKIHWANKDDFFFKGSKILMLHVIFNIIKNAFYYISEQGKGEIFIWLEHTPSSHQLHIKDTAKGMDKKALNSIFQQFFTTNPNGTGIGLNFCKKVIESFGGQISCVSQVGEYAEFILKFPLSEGCS